MPAVADTAQHDDTLEPFVSTAVLQTTGTFHTTGVVYGSLALARASGVAGQALQEHQCTSVHHGAGKRLNRLGNISAQYKDHV